MNANGREVWIVTGASGFVGSRLCYLLAEELLACDADDVVIYGLVRYTSDTSEMSIQCKQALYKGIMEVIPVDLCNSEELIRKLGVESTTYIYHCAAKGGDWGPEEDFVASNLTATEALVRFAEKCPKLKRFLHVSSVDVYPHLAPAECHESVEPVTSSRYHYSHTKANAERAVIKSSVPWTIIRPSAVYGPYSYTWGLQEALLISQGKGVLIDGANYKSGILYIDDLVECIIAASRSEIAKSRKYNAADPSSGTWKEFYDAIADRLEKPKITFSVPYWLAWFAALIMDILWRLFNWEDRPMVTFFLLRLIGNDQDWPIYRAHEDFGWAPRTPLADGIDKMMEWMERTKVHQDISYLH